jgi:hypothetical protein
MMKPLSVILLSIYVLAALSCNKQSYYCNTVTYTIISGDTTYNTIYGKDLGRTSSTGARLYEMSHSHVDTIINNNSMLVIDTATTCYVP